ncbi:hypothetical protein [Candidatus Poriferisocius sp.]|uniref:hypothetical protein n=1 Tax=Candidatus Poriferisocius sp. TaxID=3101276 RepID=UPI003B5BE8A0
MSDPDTLLEAYAQAATALRPQPSLTVGLVGQDMLRELTLIGELWNASDQPWAATGLAAAAVLAPLVTDISAVEVYFSSNTQIGLEAIAASVGLRPLEGGRLTLRPFPTVGTARLATRIDNLHLAPWPRVFVDLRLAGVRGEQAAEHLREIQLSPGVDPLR